MAQQPTANEIYESLCEQIAEERCRVNEFTKQRDALLEACNLALAGLMSPKSIDFEVLEEKLRAAIALAKGKGQ